MKLLSSKSLRSKPQKGTKRRKRHKDYLLFVLFCLIVLGVSGSRSVPSADGSALQPRALKNVFRNEFMIGAALNAEPDLRKRHARR